MVRGVHNPCVTVPATWIKTFLAFATKGNMLSSQEVSPNYQSDTNMPRINVENVTQAVMLLYMHTRCDPNHAMKRLQ
jgi:hypothetical protein